MAHVFSEHGPFRGPHISNVLSKVAAVEDINERIATDILTNADMRKAISNLLDEWKEDAPPRRERQQMRRWATKNGRAEVLNYLNALEGALRNNFGSKKGVFCFASGALEFLEQDAPPRRPSAL